MENKDKSDKNRIGAGRSEARRGYRYLPVLLLLLLTAGCAREDSLQETELAEGQRRAVIQVVSITGNKLTYLEESQSDREDASEADETEPNETEPNETEPGGTEEILESEAQSETEDAGEQGQEETGNREAPGGEMPEDMTFDGEMPEGGMFDGEMPDGMTFDGEMPEGGMFSGGMPEGGENETLPSDEGESETAWAETEQAGESETEENMGSDGEEPEEGQGGRLRGGEQSFAEAQTVYLPVNVVVHTSSDTEATFMILEAGDELEVLLEENESGEEVITEIWMS